MRVSGFVLLGAPFSEITDIKRDGRLRTGATSAWRFHTHLKTEAEPSGYTRVTSSKKAALFFQRPKIHDSICRRYTLIESYR